MSQGVVLADGERQVVRSPASLLAPGEGSDDRLVEADSGRLTKTNRRLVFASKSQSMELQLSEISDWALDAGILRVSIDGGARTFVFAIDDSPDVMDPWGDPQGEAVAVMDAGSDIGWLQPGFPKRILLEDGEQIVDADPLLPHAAAFLDTLPDGAVLRRQNVALALAIDDDRAGSVLLQLQALGFIGRSEDKGARIIFDPDGVTVPLAPGPTRFEAAARTVVVRRGGWALPPLDLLYPGEVPTAATTDIADAVHARNEEIIVRKLASFDIEARIIGRNAGPVVTQYEVQPAPRIKLSRIEALQDDLSMALAARSIRIEAPIPGKSAVGIEIPNKEFNIVALRRILEEVDFSASGSTLTFALGRDVAGRAQAVDLSKMPHLLIAGATGSGKSVMVNALITSLLCNATPDDIRMILLDTSSRGARWVQRPAASAGAGHHRARAGQVRPQVGGRRDGEPVPQVRGCHGARHQGVQRDPGGPGGPAALHRDHHRRARRPDDARGQERRGPDRAASPRRPAPPASTWSSPPSARRSTS